MGISSASLPATFARIAIKKKAEGLLVIVIRVICQLLRDWKSYGITNSVEWGSDRNPIGVKYCSQVWSIFLVFGHRPFGILKCGMPGN